MKWKKFTIETTTQAEDLVSGMLGELGVEGVEIEDLQPITKEEQKQLYIAVLPELPLDDGKACVSFYLEEGEDESALLPAVEEGLKEISAYADIGSGKISRSITEEEDWINNWKQFFKPFLVDDLMIKPSWYEMSDEEMEACPLVIQIDPGTAFGTGMHETTQLVLRQLRKTVRPDTQLLDVGCGSGILSILALKLGAAKAVGIDVEQAAVEAFAENMEANGIEGSRYRVFLGNLLEPGDTAGRAGFGCYDIVAANILADVIIPLSAVVGVHLKKGGLFIASGILNTKEAQVKQALLQNGFEILEVARQNDWVAFTARRG